MPTLNGQVPLNLVVRPRDILYYTEQVRFISLSAVTNLNRAEVLGELSMSRVTPTRS